MKSGGCAAISSTIIALHRTRPCVPLPCFTQAALAHLESIIYDPHNQMDDDDASPENAHAKDVQERNNIAL